MYADPLFGQKHGRRRHRIDRGSVPSLGAISTLGKACSNRRPLTCACMKCVTYRMTIPKHVINVINRQNESSKL